jgi:hypothetical protein
MVEEEFIYDFGGRVGRKETTSKAQTYVEG